MLTLKYHVFNTVGDTIMCIIALRQIINFLAVLMPINKSNLDIVHIKYNIERVQKQNHYNGMDSNKNCKGRL